MKTHASKPSKPAATRRPLSAYNLFYRYKRSKLLALSGDAPSASDGNSSLASSEPSRAAVEATLGAVLGLEDYPSIASSFSPTDAAVQYLRRNEIRAVLRRTLDGGERRTPRRGHGDVTFLEMNKRMVSAWRDVDPFARKVVEDLAAEGRMLYHERASKREERPPAEKKKAPVVVKAKLPEPKPPKTPKRTHKRKQAQVEEEAKAPGKEPERPKRPLTAYNLYYRFKRAHVLDAHTRGVTSKAAIEGIIGTVAGLEGHPVHYCAEDLRSAEVEEIRRQAIRSAMMANLAPKDTGKRVHRKSHGAMSFLEMGRIMCDSWKAIDDFGRELFEELAEEGRHIYQEKVKAFEEQVKLEAKKSPKKAKKSPKKAKKAALKTPKSRASPKKKARKAAPSYDRNPFRYASRSPAPPLEELEFSHDDTSIITPLDGMDGLFHGIEFPSANATVVTPPSSAKHPALHAYRPGQGLYQAPSYPPQQPTFASPHGAYAVSSMPPAPFYPEPTPMFPDIFHEGVEGPAPTMPEDPFATHCVSEIGSDVIDECDAASLAAAASGFSEEEADYCLPEASVEGIAANASFDDFMKLVAALDNN